MNWQSLSLWQHQKQAIETCEVYLSSRTHGNSALINHPTGSGKTGIMAVIAALQVRIGPVLILCPSDALVEQLISEIKSQFWQKIDAPDEWRLPHSKRLYPRTANSLITNIRRCPDGDHIVVGTVQALQQIHGTPAYSDLVDFFSVVMFDEGHREPAPSWAAAVRGLNSPTILFSATPYRNDYKLFKVDPSHINFLSFKDAADASIIRSIKIVEAEFSENPDEFARQVIERRDQMLIESRIDKNDKFIIRAGSEQSVLELYDAFRLSLSHRDERVMAIHDNFRTNEDSGNCLLRAVPPNIRGCGEVFLVHQFKLTEGIDDPACRVLAIFDRFNTERQLIQQIGRLTRNSAGLRRVVPHAFVLGRNGDGAKDIWARFLRYDQACIDNNYTPPIRGSEMAKKLLAVLPETEYVNGKFRTKADFDDPEILKEVIVPFSALIFELHDDFDLAAFGQAVASALESEDREIVRTGSLDGRNFEYRLTLRLTQSPFLAKSLFQTATLELTIFYQVGMRLFFYDSAGLRVDEHKQLKARLSPRLIASLLPENSDNTVSALTFRNTDLSPLAVRGRSMRARRLDQSGIFMGEQSHVATNAIGYAGGARRALNLAQGRIRQAEGVYQTIEGYAAWCDDIADELDKKLKPSRIFNRFAQEVPPPSNTTPKNILLDLWDFADGFVDSSDNVVEFDFEGVCVDVIPAENGPSDYPFQFNLSVAGKDIIVFLKYDAKKSKYWIKATGLSGIKDKKNERITLASRINQIQPFRIIVSEKTVFAYGKFYSVRLNLSRADGPGETVLGMLVPLEGLERIKSEKGELKCAAKTWPSGSLFRFIDDGVRDDSGPFGTKFKAFVCDDLGTESGDFIGFTDGANPRVCFIAAKWKAGQPGAGASSVYDVVAQTVKNLGYLKSDGDPIPGRKAKFDGDWKLKGGSVARRRIGPTSHEFRDQFANIRARASTRREAWLVLGGGMLSKSKIEEEFKKSKPEAHVLQLFYLLLSLYATCQSVGVEPRVYCSK